MPLPPGPVAILRKLPPQVQPGGTPISGSLSDFLPDDVFSVDVRQVEISLRKSLKECKFRRWERDRYFGASTI
jgi:hypothetical protein